LPAPVSAEVPAPANEDEVEDEFDIETFAAERRVAESRLNQLSTAYAAEMANRQHIRDSGEVPPGDNYAAGIKHIWTNKGESAQAYDNRQGYLPVTGAPYTEKYTALTGGSEHGRMITPNAPVASLLVNKPSIKKWYTCGGTHPAVAGAFWAAWDGMRWWRWVGPTDARGRGLGVQTEYTGYVETPIDMLTTKEVSLLRRAEPFYNIRQIEPPHYLIP
jgi:hypothetical protein